MLTKFAKWDIMIFRAVEILSAGSMICMKGYIIWI